MQFWLKISVIFITVKIYETRLTSLDEAKVLGTPIISCSTKWVTLNFETSVPFQGRVFIEDMAYDSRCSAQYTSNLEKNATFRFPLRPCAKGDNSLISDKISMFIANVKINFHPLFILENSKTYRIICTDTNSNGLIEEDGTANTICQHNIIRSKEDLSTKLTIGKTIHHKWTCSNGYEFNKFAFLLRKCDVISKTREVVHLIDENGCVIDDLLLNSLEYSHDKLEITAETKLFKFIDESELRFMCNIVLIPKDTPTSVVKVPKCSISREELRRRASQKSNPMFYFDQNDELYRDFATVMKDEKLKETRTITEWLNVQDLPKEAEIFKASFITAKINKTLNNDKIFKEKLFEQDVLKKFMPNQLPYNKTKSSNSDSASSISMKQIYNGQRGESEKTISSTFPKPDSTEFGRQALSLDKIEEFQDLTPTISNRTTPSKSAAMKSGSTMEDISELEKIEKILMESAEENKDDLKENMLEIDSSRLQSSELQAHEKDEIAIEHKADWRLDDVILNKTDEIIINCPSEFSKNNQSSYSIHPEALSCTWRSLNVALLLWSLGTLVIWTILIGVKVHQVIWSRDSRHHNEHCPVAAAAAARQQHQNMQNAYYHPANYHGRYGSTFYPHSLMT